MVRDKGIIELVRAFDKLKDADNCKLLLVGMFEKRDALPDDVKNRIENDPRIIYTGFYKWWYGVLLCHDERICACIV